MSNKQIWTYLLSKTGNAYGAAGIMGNLCAESSLLLLLAAACIADHGVCAAHGIN